MATPRVLLHVGPSRTGSDLLAHALAEHARALADHGVHQPARSPAEMFRAVVELRRVHRAWGYRRREVEGTWSRICRRVHQARGTVVLGDPHLAPAAPAEIDLLLDRLTGCEVHVVVTAAPPGGWSRASDPDLVAVVERWATALGDPARVHVIVAAPADPDHVWRALGDVLGVDTARLPLTDPPARGVVGVPPLDQREDLRALAERWATTLVEGGYDVHGDPAELAPPTNGRHVAGRCPEERLLSTLDELERQRVRNAVLEARNDELARGRRRGRRARQGDGLAG